MEENKKIYATLDDIENLKQEIIQEILETFPIAEEVSW